MIEETNWKKFLTEKILRECWHGVDESGDIYCCKKCGKARPSILLGEGRSTDNRTFDNESDMMELYRYIYEDGKWNKFFDWTYWVYRKTELGIHKKFIAWLFCLRDKDYESKCKMVAEFYRWE